tara:strand:- start:3303 stop:4001 length:699 start_codon:yes stop_codon:yes gene_type:complete
MKYFKLGAILIFLVLSSLVVVIINPKTSNQLSTNFKKNIHRSFIHSGMETQIEELDVTTIPPSLSWSLFKIDRTHSSDLPNSWLHIFQNVTFSDCTMSLSLNWFKINLDLDCKEIDLIYIPLDWFFVPSLNREYASDFYFTNSDFKNLESKQAWFKTSIKTDYLSINGKALGPLNLIYYFTSSTEFQVSLLHSKKNIFFKNIPGELAIFNRKSGKNFGILNKNLFFEIKKIL